MVFRLTSPLGIWRLLLLTPLVVGVGCSDSGGSLQPVQGKVLYKNNPIQGALVTLHPAQAKDDVKAVRPVGMTREDGTFTLTSGDQDGAAPGQYIVTVIWPQEVAPKGKKGAISITPPDSEDRLRGAYANNATSALRVEVKKGSKELEPIHLK